MSPIPQRFPIPTNDDDFEKMCRDLLRRYWSRPSLEIFGKRGERQYGIDILDLSGQEPLYAAQCKLKEPHKTLPPRAIEDEVAEAKLFTPPLGKYGILTTAKVSAQAQRKVREINRAHKEKGLFEVELLAWEQISELLQRYSEVQEGYYAEITPQLAGKIQSGLASISSGVASLTSKVEGNEIDAQINEARDLVTGREFQLATLLLNRLLLTKSNLLTAYQKFRIASNLGASALGNGQPEAASRHFLEALAHQPDDEKARTNEVLAYLIIGDSDAAHSKAKNLRSEYPASARIVAYWIASAPMDMRLADLERSIFHTPNRWRDKSRVSPQGVSGGKLGRCRELRRERGSSFATMVTAPVGSWLCKSGSGHCRKRGAVASRLEGFSFRTIKKRVLKCPELSRGGKR